MASPNKTNQTNKTNASHNANQQKPKSSDAGNWLIAGAVGAVLGAGVAYLLNKPEPQSCSSNR